MTQQITFSRLAAALQYLRASLHGAILETLRANARPKEVPLPEPGEPGEPFAEEQAESSEVWEAFPVMLPTQREQRLAYLLYQCGLGPKEIVCCCSQEIYHLRRAILDRLTLLRISSAGGEAWKSVAEERCFVPEGGLSNFI